MARVAIWIAVKKINSGRYMAEQKKDGNFQISKAQAEEKVNERLLEAMKEMKLFYDKGKKQWFENYKDIVKNYRHGIGATNVWSVIASRFDIFWYELRPDEKFFVSEIGIYYRLPNLNNKTYNHFEGILTCAFRERLISLNPAYKLEVVKILDLFEIHIKAIEPQKLIFVICTPAEVIIQVNSSIREKIPREVIRMLFDIIVEFMGI